VRDFTTEVDFGRYVVNVVPGENVSYLERAKQGEIEIAAYKKALWRWWEMTLQGAEAAEVEAVYNEIIRRMDELGPTAARIIRRASEVDWFERTGHCPRCGEHGERHL
jgi:hypothetical protein